MFDNSFVLRLNPACQLSINENLLILQMNNHQLSYANPDIAITTFFQKLSVTGGTPSSLWETIQDLNTTFTLPLLYYWLERLAQNIMLCFDLIEDNKNLLSIEPMIEPIRIPDEKNIIHDKWMLSRFAYIRKHQECLLIESPLGNARVFIKNPKILSIVALLTQPYSIIELIEILPEWSLISLTKVFQVLHAAAMLENPKNTAGTPSAVLQQWEFHDLLFHTRSRNGRHNYPSGGTFYFLNKTEIPPVVHPAFNNENHIPLPTTHYGLDNADSFKTILEQRCSIRVPGPQAINLHQLSEFLYHAARIKFISPITEGKNYSHSKRNYPGGGAMYELELYLAISRCQGIESGLYHYNPHQHSLAPIAVEAIELENFINQSGLFQAPDIFIIITARFARMSWKYQSIAYATTLKNVGSLFQTFYLVATALKLAPCAIGNSNSDAFGQLAGLNYYEESSVGEFLLNTHYPENSNGIIF